MQKYPIVTKKFHARDNPCIYCFKRKRVRFHALHRQRNLRFFLWDLSGIRIHCKYCDPLPVRCFFLCFVWLKFQCTANLPKRQVRLLQHFWIWDPLTRFTTAGQKMHPNSWFKRQLIKFLKCNACSSCLLQTWTFCSSTDRINQTLVKGIVSFCVKSFQFFMHIQFSDFSKKRRRMHNCQNTGRKTGLGGVQNPTWRQTSGHVRLFGFLFVFHWWCLETLVSKSLILLYLNTYWFAVRNQILSPVCSGADPGNQAGKFKAHPSIPQFPPRTSFYAQNTSGRFLVSVRVSCLFLPWKLGLNPKNRPFYALVIGHLFLYRQAALKNDLGPAPPSPPRQTLDLPLPAQSVSFLGYLPMLRSAQESQRVVWCNEVASVCVESCAYNLVYKFHFQDLRASWVKTSLNWSWPFFYCSLCELVSSLWRE